MDEKKGPEQEFKKREGLNSNLMTQLDSAEKDPFAGVCIREKFRVYNAKSFFLYAFNLVETLKNHNKS
jgi:hypothetical protein